MREFFKNCLENLESITGLRQYFYLQADPEGEKKAEIVINGMVEAAKKFNYIPEKYQQEIIKKMMVEDQNYDAINSRIVWRWLEAHKNAYSHLTEKDLTPDPEQATQEQKDYWAKLFFDGLEKIGNPEYKNGMAELRKSKGYTESIIAKDPRPKWIVGEDCFDCKGKGLVMGIDNDSVDGLGDVPCLKCDLTGKVNRYEVHASSQDEADRMYKASLK